NVLQVVDVPGVILRYQQHATRIGTYTFHRGLNGLHAERQRVRIEIVKATREQIRIDGRELEPGVTKIDRRVERNFSLLPLRAEPMLDLRHPIEKSPLEVQQRAGKRCLEMGNHGAVSRAATIVADRIG